MTAIQPAPAGYVDDSPSVSLPGWASSSFLFKRACHRRRRVCCLWSWTVSLQCYSVDAMRGC